MEKEISSQLYEGNIGKKLIMFSLPMIAGNLLQQIYNIVDTLIVGRTMGAAALAAVGSSYALMVLLTSVILGLCMGSGVIFAQLYGAGKEEEMKTSIFNAMLFVVLVSVVIQAASLCLLNRFITWLHIPDESVLYTGEYLRVIFWGILFVSIYNFVASILRSIGNTLMPLVFLGVSAVVNIVLDLVLIVVCGRGVAGAAEATVIAQALSAVAISLYFVKKAGRFLPRRQNMYFNGKLLRPVMSNSSLTAIQQSIMNFGILMVQGLVNSFGFEASAAFAAVVKIDAFAYMPAQDFGNAFATFVAQNYGAGKRERIDTGIWTAFKISGGFCMAASVAVCVFARSLMGIFIDGSEREVIRIGIQYLHIEGVFYVGIGILFLLYALYRGLGRPVMSIVLTVVSLGSRVVLAYTLAAVPAVGMVGIWWAVPIGWALADVLGMVYYLRRRKVLLEKNRNEPEQSTKRIR